MFGQPQQQYGYPQQGYPNRGISRGMVSRQHARPCP